jgi:hypothetical protein
LANRQTLGFAIVIAEWSRNNVILDVVHSAQPTNANDTNRAGKSTNRSAYGPVV